MAPRNRHDSRSGYDPTQDPTSDTYFERRNTVQTGAETHDDVANRVTTEDENSWWLQRWLSKFTRDGRIRDTYDQDMSARAQSLANGIDTRQGPIMQCSNYMAVPHPQLKTMVTEDAIPAEVSESGDKWITLGNEMVKFQNNVEGAIKGSTTEWQGSAGDAARTFMAGIGDWVGAAGQSAQLAGTQMNLQASALDEAKRSMPEPVEFDLDAANRQLQMTSDPLNYTAQLGLFQAQYNQSQAAHEEAAGVVGTYDSGLAGASTMPAFGPPPTLAMTNVGETTIADDRISENSNDRLNTNADSSSGSTGNGGTDDPGPGPVPPPSTPGDPGGPGNPNPNNPNGPGSPGSPNVPGIPGGGSGSGGSGTSPSSDLPGLPGPGQFPTPGTGGGGGGGQPGPNPNFGTPLPIGGLPGPTGGDLDRSGRGFGGGRGFGPGGSGYGGGPGSSYGPGGSGGSGPGSGQGSAPGRGPGMGGGFGPGAAAAAAEGGALGRGGPAGGRGVGGGMMPPGGRRGEGDEDSEHQRASYLVEGDPDAVFGTDEMTAPPVIGE
ncbi:PPE domain-containing protein [Actinophytocola sp.]|uniref:PPE domain-containing protein n=1 Tax=Actinophytocola sp. TaxID=1872138 RepID=UPI002ED293E4